MNQRPKVLRALVAVVLVCLVVGFGWSQISGDESEMSPSSTAMSTAPLSLPASEDSPGPTVNAAPSSAGNTDAQLARLFQEQATGVQVAGSGTVSRILADDDDGSRHQRFILELDSGQTLLIAHNVDIAPRLEGLKVGDQVSFYGEYAYSDQGGTIHWTHHDPQGKHVAGWLEWKGRRYQ